MRNISRQAPLLLLLLLLVFNFLQGRFSDPAGYFFQLLLQLPGIVVGLSFHEFAHAWASVRLGDPTPRMQGRLTISPRAHFDPFGFLCLVFCGFGWGVPVEINPNYYKNRRRDELIVSCAGIAMNILVAVLFGFFAHIVLTIDSTAVFGEASLTGILLEILLYTVIINLTLAVFNLLPVPPLDGFGIVTELFDLRNKSWYWTFYNYGMPILILLLLVGVVDRILQPLVMFLYIPIYQYIIM